MGVVVQIFRVLATVMNVVMFLSPIPSIRTIYRTKSTGHMPVVPLVAMVSNSYAWMMYGYLSGDYVALFSTCAFGVVVSIIYVGIYYRYTAERSYAHKVMAGFGLAVVLLSLYIVLGMNGVTGQSRHGVQMVEGYISNFSSVVMYTSPFEKIRQVFKHRSAVFIPIHIVVFGSINSASWVVYSALTTDWLVFAPNTFLLVIGLAQIALYLVFHPDKHPLPDSTAAAKDIVLVSPVGDEKDFVQLR